MNKSKVEVDYIELRKQLEDYSSTLYGPHSCNGCGKYGVIKQAAEQGGRTWQPKGYLRGEPIGYEAHHCSHVGVFKNLAGKILTILDASLSSNPTMHKAVKDLVKQEIGAAIQRARDLEGDNSCESTESLEHLAQPDLISSL